MAGAAQDDDEPITAINVTPLVDIVLVLLIIFMVTTEVIHEQDQPKVIPLELPTAASAQEVLNQGLLSLVVDVRGQLWLNGEKADYAGVRGALDGLRERKVTPQALISADKDTPHGEVAGLMDFLRLSGVKDIAINTKKQTIE